MTTTQSGRLTGARTNRSRSEPGPGRSPERHGTRAATWRTGVGGRTRRARGGDMTDGEKPTTDWAEGDSKAGRAGTTASS